MVEKLFFVITTRIGAGGDIRRMTKMSTLADKIKQQSNNTAPVAPPPRDNPEELPDSLVDPASEASEQTRSLPKLAETEGSAVRFPSADDPATVPVGIKIVNSKPVDYLLSFETALELVNAGKIHHSQFVVIDKVVFSQFIKEIENTMAQK